MYRRTLLTGFVSSLLSIPAFAQGIQPLKVQWDWRFEGPSALILQPLQKGYFQKSGLQIQVEPGTGSSGAVAKVASGDFDLGFADMGSLMEYHANNPDAPNKPVAVMMVYNNTPATVFTLKRYNIQRPSQLSGRKLGAPGFDAGRRTFGAFAKYNDVQVANWTTMDPPLREQMLLSGEVEAITGFGFTSQLNLEAKGAKSDDIITFPFKDYGVKLYGNAIIASPKLIQEKPEALRAFLSAFTQGVKEVVRDPNDTINTILVRDPKANIKLETKRLQLAIDTVINSPDARREGFGRVHPVRLQQMAKQITDTLNTKQAVKAQDVWNGSFLPSPDVLDGVLRR